MIPAKRWLSHTWQCLELKAESACRGAAVSASAPPTPEGRKPSWAFWSCLSGGNCHCCPASVLCLSPRDFGLSPHPDPSEFITPPATCQVRVRRGTPTFLCSHGHTGCPFWLSRYLKCPLQCSLEARTVPLPALGAHSVAFCPWKRPTSRPSQTGCVNSPIHASMSSSPR